MNLLDKSNIKDFSIWLSRINDEGGTVLIFKEKGWTSFDAVAKLRNLTKIKKVGHAGTLDPLAEGLLILCLGKATKTIDSMQAMHKSYFGTVKLGATTPTCDSEMEEENIQDTSSVTEEQIRETVAAFIGQIEQYPPVFSAKKVGGKKLYQFARANQEVEIKPSNVEIHSIDIKKIEMPFIDLDINCSKGTYIRSLARDIGSKLGVGGYLSYLQRTGIGEFKAEHALKISDIAEQVKIINDFATNSND